MTLPTPLDLGTPIDPDEVSRRVRVWRTGLAFRHTTNDWVNAARVVVHPHVYEDAYVREPDLRGWLVTMQPGYPVLVCEGVVVVSDPGLRMDEVRIRHDEVLSP